MLIHFGVIPYIVFDGDYLPSKAATEVERAKRREESKRTGLELYRMNKPSQAHLELQKAVDVTPEMARQLIDELKKIGVQYVVAPYEADAQLAYLERKGIIQGMLSEDSDLLVFGAKRLLTKLDQYGDCVEINRADFTACRDISLVGWSDTEFRRMAILSGCDYLASINRMGLKSAYRYVRKYKTIEKILQMLAFDGQYYIPTGYLERFYKAELTFLHQRVFCPVKNDIVLMNDLTSGAEPEDLSFVGGDMEQEIAIGVAKGDLNPMTKQPIHVKDAASTTPKTPWANHRRNTVDTCSNTKANKSINSFFKAKRTPLAELDPNSFTPSPTQQRLLQRASGSSWESSPASAGPPSLRPNTSMPLSSSRSPLATDISPTLTKPSTSLTGHSSSKRRRLCPDSDEGQGSTKGVSQEVGRSRFFTANISESKRSTKPGNKNKRGKETDITIWSDDSIEDAMAELSNVQERPIPVKAGKLHVFSDENQEDLTGSTREELQENSRSEDDSQSSTASRGTEASEASTSTEATNVISSGSSVAQTLNKYVTIELKALTAAYAYQPETGNMRFQHSEIENSKDHLIVNAGALQFAKPKAPQQRSLTPLQRLGAGALNRSKSCNGFLNGGVHGSPNVEPKVPGAFANDATENVPALPAGRTIGPDASTMKGSEDAIVPDSEDSADDALSDREGQTRPTIDLGRFAFTG